MTHSRTNNAANPSAAGIPSLLLPALTFIVPLEYLHGVGLPRDEDVLEKMAPEPHHPKEEPTEPVPDYRQAFSNLSNPELLSALDLALLELEKRLFRYAKVGPELLEMADEGLVLAARARARLGQSLSAAQHTEGHLQIVGVGEWRPTSTRPSWNAEPRLASEDEEDS